MTTPYLEDAIVVVKERLDFCFGMRVKDEQTPDEGDSSVPSKNKEEASGRGYVVSG